MKFGVWYGMAVWFLILKGLDIAPFAEWDWWVVLVLIVWPSLPEIQFFLEKQERRLVVFVQRFFRRKLRDTAVPLDSARKLP